MKQACQAIISIKFEMYIGLVIKKHKKFKSNKKIMKEKLMEKGMFIIFIKFKHNDK